MSTATPPNANIAERRMTVEEYLAFEEASEHRHEFANGEVIEVTGASEEHNAIVMNLSSLIQVLVLTNALDCKVYQSGMRVPVSESKWRYPDIIVTDGSPELTSDRKDLLNPKVAVEVLSPTTESDDRGQKFEEYRSVESIHEYVLVAQDRMRVERFVKDDEGYWKPAEVLTTANAELVIESIDASIPLSQIYHRVDLKA